MKLIFRKAATNDTGKIEKLLKLLKEDYVPHFFDEEREKELGKIYAGKTKAILAVTETGQAAGYLAWERYSKNKLYGYVANVGVHPKHRRKGISTKLRKIAFRQMKAAGLKGVYYTTWHTNAAMIESSRKLGMKTVRVYLDEGFRGPGGKTVLFKMDF